MVRVRAPNEIEQLSARPVIIDRDGGDHDLRQHVERVLNHTGRLDISTAHAAADRQRLRGIVAKCRHEYPAAHGL